MRPLHRLSLIEQTMEHLREGFRSGHWSGVLPGVRQLARDLDVSKDTVDAALRRLEGEGSLKSGGPGRRREIMATRTAESSQRILRVGVLLSEPLERINPHSQQLILRIVRRLENAGQVCFFSERSIQELGDKLPRVSRMLVAAKADAWVVYSAKRVVLEWFASRELPVIAIGGGLTGLPIAGSSSDASSALHACVRELTDHGHRRIVAISPDSWRVPSMSISAKAFMAAMEQCGHRPTRYNLPPWENTPEGMEKLLVSLFQVTPPTALLFVDPSSYVASLGFLGMRGLEIPSDISVVSMTTSPLFVLGRKQTAHFKWPVEEHVRRIVRWVESVARGDSDLTQIMFHSSFEAGGTIGPAKGG